MKIFLAIFFSLLSGAQVGSIALASTVDNSQNTYTCRVFEPNPNGGQFTTYSTTPSNQAVYHYLQDGIHYLEIHWYSWILNLSLLKNGVETELLGGASASHIKLRSHSPNLSVECKKDQ